MHRSSESPAALLRTDVYAANWGKPIAGAQDEKTTRAIAILPDLAAELKAALDRETALMEQVERLKEKKTALRHLYHDAPDGDPRSANGPTGLHYPEAMCNDPEKLDKMTPDDAVSRAIGQPRSKS